MSALFKKLNLGSHTRIHVLQAPASFEPELESLTGIEVLRTLPAKSTTGFVLAFAITQLELDAVSAQLCRAAQGDAVVWIAYPKGTSKRYKAEFNRDCGWPVLTAGGFDTVRQVAIDEDWSALRFRRVEYIASHTPKA